MSTIFGARYPEPVGQATAYVVNSEELAKARAEAKAQYPIFQPKERNE